MSARVPECQKNKKVGSTQYGAEHSEVCLKVLNASFTHEQS